MIRVQVQGIEQVQRALQQLGSAVRDRLMVNALHRAGKAMETMADRAVRETLNLKTADTKRVIAVRKPSKSLPIVTLFVSHKPIRLAHYGARQTKRGVTVKVLRRGARKRVGRAFLLRHASGKVVLLQREGPERLPIKPLFGPEPYQVIRQKNLEPKIAAKGREVFVSRFAHEWQREVERAASRTVSRPKGA